MAKPIPITEAPDRSCGSCMMCCKLMAIEELDKPQDKWCPHCSKGAGCTIYETRPKSCREFVCLWRAGLIPEEFKPDKVKFMCTIGKDSKTLLVFLDSHPLSAGQQRNLKLVVGAWAKTGENAVLIQGDKRLFVDGVPKG